MSGGEDPFRFLKHFTFSPDDGRDKHVTFRIGSNPSYLCSEHLRHIFRFFVGPRGSAVAFSNSIVRKGQAGNFSDYY